MVKLQRKHFARRIKNNGPQKDKKTLISPKEGSELIREEEGEEEVEDEGEEEEEAEEEALFLLVMTLNK